VPLLPEFRAALLDLLAAFLLFQDNTDNGRQKIFRMWAMRRQRRLGMFCRSGRWGDASSPGFFLHPGLELTFLAVRKVPPK